MPAMAEQIWIGLGCNLGDASRTFAEVRKQLNAWMENIRTSRIYRTRPFGDPCQPDFSNAVIAGTTALEPAELHSLLQGIEKSLGRVKTRPNGPRNIDLDLLFWGQRIWQSEILTLPHPRATQRDFVLLPMAEIDPDWCDPVSGKSVSTLIDSLSEHYFTGKTEEFSCCT